MLRSLVGSEMCIRDRYQRRVRGQVMQYKKANPNNSHNNTQGRGSIAGIGGVMMLNSGGGGVGGGGAPAESMTRVMRIYANGDGSTDAAPFDGNVPWDLTLQFHYGQNIISGTLELRGSSDLLPPQQVVVEGQIDTSRTPTPLEWGCLLYTSDAADEEDSVDHGGRRIIKKKKKRK
eukprot:TRINITY_DN51192_c0_g1_i3.p1 TRINITY_DN51192_c0_g1~~TRINITY_DN51192_c0_g1_i3.p1  ORF type:complete len:176 (+),score=70.22 TRINITY_DN51192_c0_g1_i3:136-663(+)